MFARLCTWLDHRTGYRRFLAVMLIEHIPGGAKWRYVWGSCLAFVFLVQLITGVLLMTAYSPGDSTAWGSVYYIQYQMEFGWFIRGLHHFGSQTMVVLLGLHMLQVVIAGAHLPPREVNWWLGLVLLGLVLALSLTGYLLPWDQKGYWATQVATNIAGNIPGVGQWLQKIIVGGPDYGHATLTRFFALHVAILPVLVIVFIILHLVVFRRHGVTAPKKAEGEGWFWPDQAFRDLLVSLLIFAVMIGLVLYGQGNKIDDWKPNEVSAYDRWAHAGRDGKGANLDAPANPATDYPARPEWYFLFLFQLLKYFEGSQEIIGTVLIPNGVLVLLALLPLLGYGRMRPFGHVFGVIVVGALLLGVSALTFLAIQEDRADTDKANAYRKQMKDADALAERAVNAARDGIPAEGAGRLLARDPMTEGRKLFQQNCAVCHTHGDDFKPEKPTPSDPKPTASDLKGFGTEEWIYRLLVNPGDKAFFGRTGLEAMKEAIETGFPDVGKPPEEVKKLGDAEKKQREEDLNDLKVIARWLASHPRRGSKDAKEAWFKEGHAKFRLQTKENQAGRGCAECHAYEGEGGRKGPDLTGYGGSDWLRIMIMAPYSRSRYGKNNAMPAFRDLEGVTADMVRMEIDMSRQAMLDQVKPTERRRIDERTKIEKAHGRIIQLSDVERELIIRWLLKDDRVVFGGQPIGAAPRR
ncbi:MAG: cytochrome b N-terminal domain-containing protein [Planctomycetes bacterium]|nr:cytochrome b N-terminal domain-containing protein [Planctomycetota bacterium]